MPHRLASLALVLLGACYAQPRPRQVGTSTPQLGAAGQPTMAVATPSGVAIARAPATSALPGEPVLTRMSPTTSYLVDPRTHTCLLIYAGRFFELLDSRGSYGQYNINVPLTVPVDCALLAASVPTLAPVIDWLAPASSAPR